MGVGVAALNGATGLASGVSVNVTATDNGYPGGYPNNNDKALLRDYFFSSTGNTWNVELYRVPLAIEPGEVVLRLPHRPAGSPAAPVAHLVSRF